MLFQRHFTFGAKIIKGWCFALKACFYQHSIFRGSVSKTTAAATILYTTKMFKPFSLAISTTWSEPGSNRDQLSNMVCHQSKCTRLGSSKPRKENGHSQVMSNDEENEQLHTCT